MYQGKDLLSVVVNPSFFSLLSCCSEMYMFKIHTFKTLVIVVPFYSSAILLSFFLILFYGNECGTKEN